MPPPTDVNEEDGALNAIAEDWRDGAAAEEAGHHDVVPPVEDNNDNAAEENIEDEVRAYETAVKITAVIVHVPSGREIGRVDLLDAAHAHHPCSFLPNLVVDGNETIGLGFAWEGVVMTGADVRTILILDDEQRAAKKKQKKRASAKKKDGFARGKSMHSGR